VKYIDMTSKDGRYIKVSDDKTYQDVGIYFDNADQANEFAVKLAIELLKGE
jgi:hypothetical protein